MQPHADHDGYQRIGARAPPATITSASPTPPNVLITIPNTSPFFPDPSSYNISTIPAQAANHHSNAVRTIIEYFFLVMALFLASIMIFRRLLYVRRRGQHHRRPCHNDREEGSSPQGPRSFPRTTGLPRVNLQGYPLLNTYFVPLQLPTAYTNNSRRTRAQDIDLEGCRFTCAGAEVDHDGLLRNKDALPKYESFGGPPKYAELELQQQVSVVPENLTLSTPVPVPGPPPPPAIAARSPRNIRGGITFVAPESHPSDQTTFVAMHTDSDLVPSSTRP